MAEQTEQEVEQKREGSKSTSDSLDKEVNDGRGDLVDKQKTYIEYLKGGGKSGISAQFGKPMWLISESPKEEVGTSADGCIEEENGGIFDSIKSRVTELFRVVSGEEVISKRSGSFTRERISEETDGDSHSNKGDTSYKSDTGKGATNKGDTSYKSDRPEGSANTEEPRYRQLETYGSAPKETVKEAAKDAPIEAPKDAPKDAPKEKEPDIRYHELEETGTKSGDKVEDKKVVAAAAAIREACEGNVDEDDGDVMKFVKGLGTDDDTVVKILESLTEDQRKQLDAYYREKYGVSLKEQLLGEADSPEERDYYTKLVDRKDGEVVVKEKSKHEKEIESVDRDKVKKAAEVLHDELGLGYTDRDKVMKTLEDLSDAEREVLKEIYKEQYDESLTEELKDEFIGDNEKRALALLNREDKDSKAEGVNANTMSKAADALAEEMDSFTGPSADKVHTMLKDKSEKERAVIAEQYRLKTGRSLEADIKDKFDGAELDKVLNALNRKDGSADDAGRIHTALIERDQIVEGRSDETCEKDIRDTLATMNSDQIEQLKRDYKERYGVELEDALLKDENLSDATKEALKIYLKGTDKRTDEDTLKLADIALKAEDIDMFQEAFRSSSQAARDKFFENGGKEKIEDAFWGTDEDHAMEFARHGELSTTTLLNDNQSWLGDNERAIEAALEKMKDSERQQYLKGKELAAAGKTAGDLSGEDKKAFEYYQKMHEALEDAGDSTEVARWEDMIKNKGGSLVSKLAAHCGTVYDDDLSVVVKDIENMSEADWKKLKGPEGAKYREEIEKALKTYLSDDDVKRCMDVVDRKMEAKTFGDASTTGRRTLLEALGDVSKEQHHWYGTNVNEDDVYDAIAKMTPEEQERYRNDPEYKKQVDEKVTGLLELSEETAAMAMLERVSKGQPPEDITTKVLRHAADTDPDEAKVVRDVLKEFKDHPEVRERIVNPKTPEDQAYRAKFEEALKSALGPFDFDKYGKPIMETGRLPIDVQMQLNEGVFDDDEQGYYTDILALAVSKDKAAQEEKDKILNDKEYQEKVLGALSKEEREVALNALKQGEMKPEDKIRSHLIGAGTGEEEVKEALRGLSPAEKEIVKNEYARKYGQDLTYHLLDELGGQDATDAKRAIKRDSGDSRTEFNDMRDEFYASRDGVGKAFVDSMWDGTGYQADEAFNNFAKAMTEYSARFEELPPEKRKELIENLQKGIDLFKESKGQIADALTDAAIAIACVVGGFVTEGSTWVILGALVVGGFFKVGAKGAIVGSDYDWSSSDVLKDFASGGVDAALSFVGPGAGAQLFKIGERAGISAAKVVLKEAVTEGGEKLIKEGAEKAVEKGMINLVRDSIANGSYKISEKGVDDLVEKIAKEGATKAEKDALRKSIKESLDEAVKKEGESAIKRMATEYFLNAGAGAMGGAGGGTVRGFASWDESKSFAENMANVGKMAAMSAGFGAAGAVAFTAVFKVGGKAYHALKEHYNLKPGERLTPEQLDDLAKKSGGKDATAKYNENGDIEITSKVEGKPPRKEMVSPDELSKMREWDLLTPAQKTAMLERLAKDPMYSPDAVGGFADDASKIMKGWEGKGATERAAELQKLMDDFNDAHGLPRSKIKLSGKDMGAEGASYADGVIEVSEADLLGKVDKATLIERLYHEAVHNQQDALVVRSLADELKVGKSASADEARRLKDLYKERTGRELSDEHLSEVLKTRDGKPLTPEQAVRAKEAADSFKDYPFNRPEYQEAMDHWKVVKEQLANFEKNPKASQELIEKLSKDDGTLSKHLFGTDKPPKDVQALIDGFKANGSVPKESADNALKPLLNKRNAELHDVAVKAIQDYHKNLNEVEAYAIGRKAKLQAERSFASGETVKIGEREFSVVGSDGEHVLVRPKSAAPPDGPAIKTSDADFAGNPPKFRKVNEDYYADADGNFYKVRTASGGGKELVADTDVFEVKPERLARTENSVPRGSERSGVRSQDIDDEPTQEIKIPKDDKAPDTVRDGDTIPPAGRDTPDGRLKPAADEPPPLVKDILDRADIPPHERADLLARIKENKLATAENLDKFARDASDITSKWKDVSHLTAQAEASAKQLQDAFGKYREKLLSKLPDGMTESDLLKLEPGDVRKLFKDDPDVIKALDDYVRVREANAKVQENYHNTLKQRVDEMQKLFDEFADKNGLPRVKLEAADSVRLGDADGMYDNGKIMLRESDILGNRDPMKFMEIAYHEFVHNQQDGLILRSVIDDVEKQVGRKLTADDMSRLKELKTKMEKSDSGLADAEFNELAELETAVGLLKKGYKDKAGGTPSDERLAEVLRARDGKPLTAEERFRADELGKAWKENAPPGEAYKRAGNDLMVTNSELNKLDQPWSEYDLIKRLGEDNGTLSRHLFGTDKPPAEVQRIIELQKRMDAGESLTWPSEYTKGLLKDLLKKQAQNLTDYRTALYKEYLTGFHEQEAWVIGRTMRNGAQEKGITGRSNIADRPPESEPSQIPRRRDTLPGFPVRKPGDTIPGVGSFEAPSQFAGEKVRVNNRDYVALAEDGDDVILRRVSNPTPLGEPVSIDPSEIGTRYKPLGDTGYYRTPNGDAYILREGPNGPEMVLDRNVAPIDRKEFLELREETLAK